MAHSSFITSITAAGRSAGRAGDSKSPWFGQTRRLLVTEFDPTEVDEYRYLWTTDKEDYVLLRIDHDEDTNFLIVNMTQRYPEAKVFFDDRLSATIKQHMIAAGVPIVAQCELDDAFQRTRAKVTRTGT
jgi:hypothetical protein